MGLFKVAFIDAPQADPGRVCRCRPRHLLFVKSNSNLSILKVMAEAGSSFDVVSGGELYRVKKAGGDTSKVAFAGVGKTDVEITFALAKDILMFNVESEPELDRISAVPPPWEKLAPLLSG